jgi:hypothetical protein
VVKVGKEMRQKKKRQRRRPEVISLRAGAKVYRVKETGSKDEVESI